MTRHRQAGAIEQPLPACTYPAESTSWVSGDERVVRDITGHHSARANGRKATDVVARDHNGARSDRSTCSKPGRTDDPVVRACQVAVRSDRPWKTIIRENHVGPDEHAIVNRDALVDQGRVLNLHAVADDDADVDVGVATHDAVGANTGTGPYLSSVPDGGPGTDRDTCLNVRGCVHARSLVSQRTLPLQVALVRARAAITIAGPSRERFSVAGSGAAGHRRSTKRRSCRVLPIWPRTPYNERSTASAGVDVVDASQADKAVRSAGRMIRGHWRAS